MIIIMTQVDLLELLHDPPSVSLFFINFKKKMKLRINLKFYKILNDIKVILSLLTYV
jgi:hypothetical protein